MQSRFFRGIPWIHSHIEMIPLILPGLPALSYFRMKSDDSANNMKVYSRYSRTSTAVPKPKSISGSKGIVELQIPYHTNLVHVKKLKNHLAQLLRQVFVFDIQEKKKRLRVSFINRACLLLSHCRTINFLSKWLSVPTTALVCWKGALKVLIEGLKILIEITDLLVEVNKWWWEGKTEGWQSVGSVHFFPGASTWRNQRKMSLFH